MSEQRTSESFPIVGSHYRPPAKGLLQGLPSGTELWLEPEPDNPFDGNAVKVLISGSTVGQAAELSEAIKQKLENELSFFGYDLADVVSREEIQLGYVPKGLAAELAPKLSGQRLAGVLSFSPTGVPQISVETAELAGCALWRGCRVEHS